MVIKHAKKAGGKFFTKLFLRFFTGGLAGYAFSLLVTYIGADILGFDYFLFYVIAFTLTTLFNFIVAVKYIFKVTDKYHTRFIKYACWTIGFYFANISLVKMLTDYTNLHYLLAITIVTGFFFMLKFLIYDQFVFHHQ